MDADNLVYTSTNMNNNTGVLAVADGAESPQNTPSGLYFDQIGISVF